MRTHAMLPVADHIRRDEFRVYFSGRDARNRSHIGFVILDLKNPKKILHISPKPLLTPGDLGCFDDNGVTPSWILDHRGKKYLYYIGWNKRSTVRMSLLAGLAISVDGGQTFERNSKAPILERNSVDPYALNTAPCVLFDQGLFRMWYVSGVEWINPNLPRYHIKYADSRDGIQWTRDGRVALDFKSKNENALARPCVLKDGGIYKMWFSFKGSHYRIGYAESADGLNWTRNDAMAAISPSRSGWDSEMIEYAFVFTHKGRKHMFYNGNRYGRGGIGYAELDESA